MDWYWWATWLLCALGLAQAGLLLLHAWENRRYHKVRLRSALPTDQVPAVTLFIPCKGLDLHMEANLRALFEQDYSRLTLCFLIEGGGDAAAAVIARLQSEYPSVPSRVVVCGKADGSGQKVHNLVCGTEQAQSGDAVLAFVDSDARPNPEWLGRLVSRLKSGKFAVATGYRWYVPVRPTFVNRLLSAINNTVVNNLGPHGFNLVWGGAWAMKAETFRGLGLPGAWRGSLSDDLVVSRLVRQARLQVAYEPHCLVQSSADFTWSGLAEFLRRQYLIVKVYAPVWWWSALLLGGLSLGVLGGLLALAIHPGTGSLSWIWPAAGALLHYLTIATRAAIAAGSVRPFIDLDEAEYRKVSLLNIWGWPLVSLVIWMGLAASSIGRTIVWRGIRYRLDSPTKTTILNRPPEESSLRSPARHAA
ncbi:MAG: glycosyltransferase [Planctomycetales bacterium]